MRLDATNLDLLHALSRNSRTSVTDLAAGVNRSESAVRERLAQLEAEGFLKGYTARLDLARLGLPVWGHVRARCDLRQADAIAHRLAAIPEVVEARITTGPRPLRIEVCTPDLESLQLLMATRFSALGLDGMQVEVTTQTLVEPRLPDVSVLGENRHKKASEGDGPLMSAAR